MHQILNFPESYKLKYWSCIISDCFCFIFLYRDNQQNLFNILGSMYLSVILNVINNTSLVMPFVATERAVLYREKFAGMYSLWAYSLAQVLLLELLLYIFCPSENYMIFFYWLRVSAISGGHRDPLCIHPSSPFYDHRIPNYRLLLVSLQSFMVFLHHVLHVTQLCLSWNASYFLDSKCSSGLHTIIIFQSKLQYLLWLHDTSLCEFNLQNFFIFIIQKYVTPLE